MTGQNVICFAKDWEENPTSNNHVMRELAKANRVLWLNSVSTRAPRLGNRRDLGKLLKKLKGFFGGLKQVDARMWVYTPLVIPLPHSRVATAANRLILRLTIAVLRRKLGMRHFQLWTFLPNVGDYVGRLGESLVVYYCVDEWSKFSYVNGERTAAAEQALCRRADLVFATATSLVDRRRHLNPETHLATHGVDHGQFSKALNGSVQVPPDLAALPRPVLGFYGTIQDWVDLDLVAFLAGRHPEWSIVLVGNTLVDVSGLARYANVHVLGRRPHGELPAYCKGFDVALLPQKVNELTLHMSPIKLREYLSAGLPVVSTALPEVMHYPRELCSVAHTYEEFEQGVLDALRNDSPEKRRLRSRAMAGETWERRVAAVCEKVMRVGAARGKAKLQIG
jgi:glycosyltransferase involved in cell wall biosynthesis